jgi:asparagine N-glycosylation enzyme membrane subunit Stt3
MDLHVLIVLVPVGLWYCVTKSSEGKVFIVAYVITAVYFTGVMVRLMLVLAPAACVISSVAVSEVLSRLECMDTRLPVVAFCFPTSSPFYDTDSFQAHGAFAHLSR